MNASYVNDLSIFPYEFKDRLDHHLRHVPNASGCKQCLSDNTDKTNDKHHHYILNYWGHSSNFFPVNNEIKF